MRRRCFIVGAMAIPTWRLANAQSRQPHRIGFLYPQSDPGVPHPVETELAALGYVDGRTATFIRRFANGRFDRMPSLAEELVNAEPDIIVASTTASAVALKKVTDTIAIVVLSSGDAVGSGLAASLARPGGNVTGNSFLGTELAAKQVELITELRPNARHVGFMANSRMPPEPLFFGQMQVALKVDALICAPGGYSDQARDRAVMLAAIARRPSLALHFRREFPDEGGLISHGPRWAAMFRQAAAYVDRILKGARAADLPIVQPSIFELVINLKTARAMGFTIPPAILARADEVIE